MLDLTQEIIKIKLIAGNFLLQFFGFFGIELFLSLFYQGHDISHPQNTVGHTFGMEGVQSFEFLSGSDILDRFVHYRTDRKSGPPPGISIQFGQNHSVEIQPFVKFAGSIHCILTGHRIDHKQGFIRMNSLFDCSDLVHHLLVDSQTSCRIDNHHIIPLRFGLFNGIQSDPYRIFGRLIAIYRHLDLFAQNFQLLDSSGTINVTSHQQRFLPFFILQ